MISAKFQLLYSFFFLFLPAWESWIDTCIFRNFRLGRKYSIETELQKRGSCSPVGPFQNRLTVPSLRLSRPLRFHATTKMAAAVFFSGKYLAWLKSILLHLLISIIFYLSFSFESLRLTGFNCGLFTCLLHIKKMESSRNGPVLFCIVRLFVPKKIWNT